VEHLGKVTPLAKTYLIGTRPLGLRDNVLVVGFDSEFADRREFVDTVRNRELLQAKLKEALRMDVSLRFEIAEGTAPPSKPPEVPPGKSPAAAKAPSPVKKTLDDFKDDPLIKKALEIFKGTIVEVRK
jgi:DNA polymerase-3 subunit gamma/tau